jgi:hypothetical protein
MSLRQKATLACAVILLFLLVIGVSAVVYIYHHPQTLKAFLEESFARTTGASLSIDKLTYSLKPLHVTAEGIIVKHGEARHQLEVELSAVDASMALKGPLGRRTLIVENLTIEGLGFRLPETGTLPQPPRGPTSLSWSSRVARQAVAYLLFKEIELQAVLMSDGDIQGRVGTYDVHLHDLVARRTAEGLLIINGGLRSRSAATERNLTARKIAVSTDRAISLVDPQISCRAEITEAVFESSELDIRGLTGTAEVVLSKALQGVTLRGLALQTEEAVIKRGPGMRLAALKISSEREVRFTRHDKRVEAPHLRLILGEVLSGDVQLDSSLASPVKVLVKSIEGRLTPQKTLALLPEQLRNKLAPLALAAPVKLRGWIEGRRDSETWDWRCDLKGLLERHAASLAIKPIRLDGIVSGFVQATGTWPDIAVLSQLKTDNTTLEGVGVGLDPFRTQISLKGKPPILEIEEFKADLPQIRIATKERGISFADVRLEAPTGRIDGTRNTLRVPGIRFHSASLTNLLISLAATAEDVSLELRGEKTGLLESIRALNVMPSGWLIKGDDRLELTINVKDKNDLTFTSHLTLGDLDFQNADGSRMGAKIATQLDARGAFGLKQRQITLRATLETRRGEMLYDRFYLDFEKTPLLAAMEGRLDIGAGSISLNNGQLGLENVFRFDVRGHMARGKAGRTLSLTVALPETPLFPIYSQFLFEPFHMERPVLNGIEAGGNVSAEVHLERDDTWKIKGSCKWHDGNLAFTEQAARFSGIDLDLPLWYRSGGAPGLKEKVKGRLAIESLTLPPLPEQALNVVFEVAPNELSVPAPTTLEIAGGQLRLGPVAATNLYAQSPTVVTSLDLNSNDLNPVLGKVWPEPIRGTLRGRLDPLRIHKRTLSGKGTLTAKVFGGKLFLTDIAAARLLTPTQLLRLTARWQDLNLAALTRGTTFGKIEGVLQGHAEKLEIVSGQPQRFDLLLETVKTPGVAQKISVTAVDNIAQIGGGESPFIGMAGALSTFFKEFAYEKIGLRASLENDVFRINGTIREGGKEYFVKRGGFSGVNIVNQNLDNQISFKDMLKRIKRVTADGTQPVIE